MKYSFFDWHCDTASVLLATGQRLAVNDHAVSLERASRLSRYVQVMAYFTSPKLTNEEGWERVNAMHRHLTEDPAVLQGNAVIRNACPPNEDGVHLLLSIEDARILNGRLERLELLREMGIRILTPLWNGVTCIGGAHNTNEGLTAFGAKAVDRAITLGMLPDISHASERSADEIFQIAALHSTPVIASHSNAYNVCPVSRNLRNGQIREILRSRGVIGLNLYVSFLSKDPDNASVNDVLRHVDYFLEQGAEDALCFGCDMDGAKLPRDIPSLEHIPQLAEAFGKRYSENTVHKLLFENAYSFAKRALPSSAKNP
ncbi:MAG: hypothetical protein E7620_03105 [Ruminococcaceae bacterium]|nr:hypothetical protein [Oscillospiraceae bacterium]